MNSLTRLVCSTILTVLVISVSNAQKLEKKSLESSYEIKFFGLAKNLTLGQQDFRSNFFGNRVSYENIIRDGNFVFIYGVENRYKILSTNDCPTILDAVVKCSGRFSNMQVRIVRKDAIIQSPFDAKRNFEEMNAFRQLRINSGDLVILTLMD